MLLLILWGLATSGHPRASSLPTPHYSASISCSDLFGSPMMEVRRSTPINLHNCNLPLPQIINHIALRSPSLQLGFLNLCNFSFMSTTSFFIWVCRHPLQIMAWYKVYLTPGRHSQTRTTTHILTPRLSQQVGYGPSRRQNNVHPRNPLLMTILVHGL